MRWPEDMMPGNTVAILRGQIDEPDTQGNMPRLAEQKR